MKITRVFAIASKDTFLMRPVRRILQRYVGTGKNWIDPFAGDFSPAEFTNDLNPDKSSVFHMHALDFAKSLDGIYEGVLFDPPYSLTQVKQCYDNIGYDKNRLNDSKQMFNDVKKIIAHKIKPGGYAICFGWNSRGFGRFLGFEFVEIIIINHGGAHNDTIVTVEKKRFDLFD